MITVLLIRHAQSVANTQRHLVGGRSSHTPLSPLGQQQAIDLGATLAQLPAPDRIITSPAKRARETARLSLQGIAATPRTEIYDEVQEMSQGAAEGQPRDEVYTAEVKSRIASEGKAFALPHEGAESMNDVADRIETFLRDLVSQSNNGDTLYVYTHGIAICCYLGKLFHHTQEEVFQQTKTLPNASITRLVFTSPSAPPQVTLQTH